MKLFVAIETIYWLEVVGKCLEPVFMYHFKAKRASRFSAVATKGVSLLFPFYEHKILLFSFFFPPSLCLSFAFHSFKFIFLLSTGRHRVEKKNVFVTSIESSLKWGNSFRKRIWFARYERII